MNSDMSPSIKTALVTGASKRLGKATALALAGEGYNIVIHYNRSKEQAEQVRRHIADTYKVQAWTVQAELNDNEQARSLIEQACALAGPIDVLVNNASIFPGNKLMDITEQDVFENIRVNALSPFEIGRSFYSQTKAGVIINFLDTRIVEYDKLHAAYHISKRMFFTLTRMMALEFAPAVRVNAVAPGLILPPPGKDESFLKKYAKNNFLNTYGSVDDITSAVLFLIKSRFITGQVIFVDGGNHMKGYTYG